MDYPLENLGPERFQQFCQAMLAREYKELQCFPVAQPDGGRDGWLHRRTGTKTRPALFQVKFVRRADLTADAHQKLVDTMKGEVTDLDPRILKGVEKYIVLTNVSGTAHQDKGSIDKLQKVLDDGLPIPGVVWWRDDIARRLDGAWDIKWAYPEIMTGQDLLRALVESGLKEDQSRRANAIKAFLADQYSADQDVKFKQVELQNRLVELFVDVPASVPHSRADGRPPSVAMMAHSRVAHAVANLDRGGQRGVVREILREDGVVHYREDRAPVGAGTLLLHPVFQAAVPRLVLEGAPGQGKSTIGQYICQVHRARLLHRDDMLGHISPDHVAGPVRIPFRIDLRDLALWLGRRDPFNADNDGEPPHWQKSLEAFMSAQVRNASGGAEFSVSDLHALLVVGSFLLVFDGLDEVADVDRRKDVVDEIARATNRLMEMTISLQVVVTSRPAAFANSPGPSEADFPYFHLDSLPQSLVIDYSERWIKVKRLTDREGADLRRVLKEKLEQPHMRDLARNPMQLAILLSLMHTRGASLPDKRTALYDSYVDLFFSREAEKSATVKEHRDLLIDIHRHLAWLLHGEAQVERSSGSITDDRLRQVVRAYLEQEGHETALVDELFTGMVTRVVALVSRVQGTREFEVQPLREYFAAKHLYETAPYSPTGREKRGTRPDRFDALARDFYWLNVTRFYAGCFCKGELPALVDRIEALLTEAPYRHTAHPRVLSAMLLSDWVFAQHPRSVATLVALLLDGGGLRVVAAAMNQRARAPAVLVLPKSSGRDELVRRSFTVLSRLPARDYSMELVEVLRSNGTPEMLESEWRSRIAALPAEGVAAWMEYGQYLGVLSRVSDADVLRICDPLEATERMQVLFAARRASLCVPEDDPAAEARLVEAILNLDVHGRGLRPHVGVYDRLASVVEPTRYCVGARRNEPYPLRASWRQFGDDGTWLDEPAEGSHGCDGVFNAVAEATRRPSAEWATSLDPWSLVVDAILLVRPRAWSAVGLACIAAGIVSAAASEALADDLFDESRPLAARMRAARLRAGQAGWWSRTLAAASSPDAAMMAVVTASVWASAKTVAAILPELEKVAEGLSVQQWTKVSDAISSIQWNRNNLDGGRPQRAHVISEVPPSASERMLPILVGRASPDAKVAIYRDVLVDYRGQDAQMLEVAQGVAFQRLGDPACDWKREIAVISHAYMNGVVADTAFGEPFFPHARSLRPIPQAVAAEIVENGDRYPSILVQTSQIICARSVLEELVPVAKVAEREQWFDEVP